MLLSAATDAVRECSTFVSSPLISLCAHLSTLWESAPVKQIIRSGFPSLFLRLPEGLMNSGLGIIGVNYRLLPKSTIQETIDDAAAAVAWAFHEVAARGGSPDKIFVGGHSAGGYLTDMVVLDKSWLEKYGVDADRIAGAFPYSAQVITHYNVRSNYDVGPLSPRIDETAPLYHVRKIPMPMLVLSGDRELELYGRYEEQAYFWRMMKLNGNEQVYLYEFDGYDHGSMPQPAHAVVKRYIRGILRGQIPERRES